jgi:hypothetical protein
MSKKDITTGEEFEDFLSFAMNYNIKQKSKKKEKNYYRPSEIGDIYRQNGMPEEMLYKRLLNLGSTPNEAKEIVRRCFHPTVEDLEKEKLIKDEDLYSD